MGVKLGGGTESPAYQACLVLTRIYAVLQPSPFGWPLLMAQLSTVKHSYHSSEVILCSNKHIAKTLGQQTENIFSYYAQSVCL